MGGTGQAPDAERFGSYLRQVRESRKLSLDAVEEMAVGYADRITKSHLSRIENGHAEPTFRRMYALSQIYGVPVTMFAERFEMELLLEDFDEDGKTGPTQSLDAARHLEVEGRFLEALKIYDSILAGREADSAPDPARTARLRLRKARCLLKLERFRLAKEECESILDDATLAGRHRAEGFYSLGIACFRLGRMSIAKLALDKAASIASDLEDADRILAAIMNTRGNIAATLGQFDEALRSYDSALGAYSADRHPFEWCDIRQNCANALLSLGDLEAAREALVEVVRLSESRGYERQLAVAVSTLGALHWQCGELEAAETCCIRSNAIARPREFISLVFRNCFYLWKIAITRNDEVSRAANERTLRSYMARTDNSLQELAEFRGYLSGGEA